VDEPDSGQEHGEAHRDGERESGLRFLAAQTQYHEKIRKPERSADQRTTFAVAPGVSVESKNCDQRDQGKGGDEVPPA